MYVESDARDNFLQHSPGVPLLLLRGEGDPLAESFGVTLGEAPRGEFCFGMGMGIVLIDCDNLLEELGLLREIPDVLTCVNIFFISRYLSLSKEPTRFFRESFSAFLGSLLGELIFMFEEQPRGELFVGATLFTNATPCCD